MRQLVRAAVLMAVILCVAWPAMSQGAKAPAPPSTPNLDAKTIKAFDDAMTPGPGQKKLDAMVGTFDVSIKTWPEPGKAPVESKATCINAWVLGGRFVQMSWAGYVAGDLLSGFGYMAYDNTAKVYEAAWMDTGSTGIVFYKGGFDSAGKMATMKASIADPVTGKATPLELRVTMNENGGHVTEMWGMGLGDTMFKMMELTYTRTK